MQKWHALLLIAFISACNSPSPSLPNNDKASKIDYSIVNARNENGIQFYDVYLKNTDKIRTLNSYLVDKYNSSRDAWIEINYFSDSAIAKSYFTKQFDNSISDKEKDRLFRYYLANYKYNPTSKYDSLVFEH